MLSRRERYAAVPFFWTRHYDISIDYVGHAAAWDRIEQDGDTRAHDVALRLQKHGRTLAVVTIFRGRESLEAELAMEQDRPKLRRRSQRCARQRTGMPAGRRSQH